MNNILHSYNKMCYTKYKHLFLSFIFMNSKAKNEVVLYFKTTVQETRNMKNK